MFVALSLHVLLEMRTSSYEINTWSFHNCLPPQSVKEAAAAPGPTITVEFVTLILNGKLVVISELFTTINFAQSKDDNVLLAFHIDYTRVAIWFTGVVNKTCCVSMHGGINNVKVINSEHVAADPLHHKITKDFSVFMSLTQCRVLRQLNHRTICYNPAKQFFIQVGSGKQCCCTDSDYTLIQYSALK